MSNEIRPDLCSFQCFVRLSFFDWTFVRHLCEGLVTLACVQRKCFEFEFYSNNCSSLEFKLGRDALIFFSSLQQILSLFLQSLEKFGIVGRCSETESLRESEFSCTSPFRLEWKIIQRQLSVQASNDLMCHFVRQSRHEQRNMKISPRNNAASREIRVKRYQTNLKRELHTCTLVLQRLKDSL